MLPDSGLEKGLHIFLGRPVDSSREAQPKSVHPAERRYSHFCPNVLLEGRITSYDKWFLIKHNNNQAKHFSEQGMLYIKLSQAEKTEEEIIKRTGTRRHDYKVWRAWDYF